MFLGGRAIRPNEITFPRLENKPQTQQLEKKLYFSVKRRKIRLFSTSKQGKLERHGCTLSGTRPFDLSFSLLVPEDRHLVLAVSPYLRLRTLVERALSQ